MARFFTDIFAEDAKLKAETGKACLRLLVDDVQIQLFMPLDRAQRLADAINGAEAESFAPVTETEAA